MPLRPRVPLATTHGGEGGDHNEAEAEEAEEEKKKRVTEAPPDLSSTSLNEIPQCVAYMRVCIERSSHHLCWALSDETRLECAMDALRVVLGSSVLSGVLGLGLTMTISLLMWYKSRKKKKKKKYTITASVKEGKGGEKRKGMKPISTRQIATGCQYLEKIPLGLRRESLPAHCPLQDLDHNIPRNRDGKNGPRRMRVCVAVAPRTHGPALLLRLPPFFLRFLRDFWDDSHTHTHTHTHVSME